MRHGFAGAAHALSQGALAPRPSSGVGEKPLGMPMERPVAAQIMEHGRGQRDQAVPGALSVPNPEFVVLAGDVVNGEVEAFGEPKSAAVDELERGAITPQTDVKQKVADLGTGQNSRQGVTVLGPDLGEEGPIRTTEHLQVETTGTSGGLANSLGLPAFDALEVDEVIAQLLLGQGSRIAVEVLADQAQLTVIGMPGTKRVVSQGQKAGVTGERVKTMGVSERVRVRTPGAIGGLRILGIRAPS